MLKFSVQGSAPTPYVVTVEGEGADIRVFCTCPGGRRGVKFCKHAKAVIEGDASRIVQPSDDLAELARRVSGTAIARKAANYVPSDMREKVPGCSSVRDVFERYRERLEEQGFVVEFVEDRGDFPYESVAIFGRFKNGKPRKTASAELRRDSLIFDFAALDGGEVEPFNIRPREKPFTVRGAKGSTYAHLDSALYAFLKLAGINIVDKG